MQKSILKAKQFPTEKPTQHNHHMHQKPEIGNRCDPDAHQNLVQLISKIIHANSRSSQTAM